MPAKRRTRANTSFHALSLSVRPTAGDSNAMQASFNHNSSSASYSPLYRNRDRDRMIQRARRSRPSTALSSLRMAAETDNCGSALWLPSFARASSLFRSASFCFLRLAKSILLDRCLKFSENNPIQQRPGRIQENILRDIRLQERRPKFRTKLVRQRRSHG